MGSYDYENAVTLLQDCFKRIATKQGINWDNDKNIAI